MKTKAFLVGLLVTIVTFCLLVWATGSFRNTKEAAYSIWVPPATSGEAVERWFHTQSREVSLSEFKELNLPLVDYRLEVRRYSFVVTYVGVDREGGGYSAEMWESWMTPFAISSWKMEDNRLSLSLRRETVSVVAIFVPLPVAVGVIAFLLAYVSLIPVPRDGKKTE